MQCGVSVYTATCGAAANVFEDDLLRLPGAFLLRLNRVARVVPFLEYMGFDSVGGFDCVGFDRVVVA